MINAVYATTYSALNKLSMNLPKINSEIMPRPKMIRKNFSALLYSLFQVLIFIEDSVRKFCAVAAGTTSKIPQIVQTM